MNTLRNFTDINALMRLVKTIETLVTLGRPLNKALHDVANANGATQADVKAILKLINSEK